MLWLHRSCIPGLRPRHPDGASRRTRVPPPPPPLPPPIRSETSFSACGPAASRPSSRTCAWCWRTAAPCCSTPRLCRRCGGAGGAALRSRVPDMPAQLGQPAASHALCNSLPPPCPSPPHPTGLPRAGSAGAPAPGPQLLARRLAGGAHQAPAAPVLSRAPCAASICTERQHHQQYRGPQQSTTTLSNHQNAATLKCNAVNNL